MVNRLFLLPNEILQHIYSFLAKSELLVCLGGLGSAKSAQYLHTTKWKPFPDMLAPRGGYNAVAIENVIYVVGGSDENWDAVSTMESFHFESSSWRHELQMSTARRYCVAATIQDAGVHTIVVSGGENRKDGHLQMAEMFNTRHGNWSTVANMREKRVEHCAVTFKNEIYVFGGSDEEKILSTCKKYSPVENMWHDIPNMLRPRTEAAATVANS